MGCEAVKSMGKIGTFCEPLVVPWVRKQRQSCPVILGPAAVMDTVRTAPLHRASTPCAGNSLALACPLVSPPDPPLCWLSQHRCEAQLCHVPARLECCVFWAESYTANVGQGQFGCSGQFGPS